MKYILYCIIILILSLVSFYGEVLPFFDKFAPVFFIITGVWYMMRNRRDSLFCPELLFFVFGFINTFFTLIVSDIPLGEARFFDMFTEDIVRKSNCLSLICLSSFSIGIELANLKAKRSIYKTTSNGFRNVPTNLISYLNIFTIILIIYISCTGLYQSAFKYSQIGGGESEGFFYLMFTIITALLLVTTICEFIRLRKMPIRFSYKSQFMFFRKNVNKTYLFNIMLVSLFLLLTGNRNDMMMILLPVIILYHFFIEKFDNKRFLAFFGIGFCVMFLIGMTRTDEFEGQSVGDNISLYYALRDFSAANIDQLFLVQYGETHAVAGLEYGLKVIVASIPFLSGIFIGNEGFSEAATKNSNNLTTTMMNEGGGGMGTSLFGDLYFCGGIIFAVIYMFILGYYMTNAYSKLKKGNSINIISLIFFCTFFSNMIYVLRSTWYAMFRPIGFALIIMAVMYLIGNKNKSYNIWKS